MNLRFPLATLAGVVTWLLVSLVTLVILQRLPGETPVVAIITLLLLYGISFIFLTQEQHPLGLLGQYGRYLVAVPLLCAFALLILLPPKHFDYLAILTIIWVCLLPHMMSQQRALLVTALVVVVWFSLQAWLEQRSLWISASLYGTFHLFAVVMQSAITAEQQAKLALAAKHVELQSAQQLLLAASRQSERTRIARNLHDLLGHHLTALTIQLQVASYHTEGEAKQQVDNSLQLARLLLSDVREAVSAMREQAELNLKQLLTPSIANLADTLSVKLTMTDDIILPNVLQAQHVLMVVQEAISNTLKHAAASEFYIVAQQQPTQLVITLSDNGRAQYPVQFGNGLIGMQERLAECGGQLQVQQEAGGVQLQLFLPYELAYDLPKEPADV